MISESYRLWKAFLSLAVFGIGLLSALSAHSHPFHLCVGQMKWNVETKVWEVSLRLHPQDLENAMSAELSKGQATKRVSIEDTGFSDLATKYLGSHFFLRRSPIAMNKEEFKAILRADTTRATVEAPLDPSNDELAKDVSSIAWVGMEPQRGWLWIHFELTQPSVLPERQKLWFVHRLLLDSVERQENTIAIDPTASEKFSLQFRLGDEFQEMKPKVK